MDQSSFNIEELWDRLLSRDAQAIRAAYTPLSEEERRAVSQHLLRMSSEPGWHVEQRASAQAALQALQELPRD